MSPSSAPRRPATRSALAAILCLNLLFVGADILAFRPTNTSAQGELPAGQQAVLDQVRALVGNPSELAVQQRPDGSYFADAEGKLQAVLLAATNADGEVITRCVSTVEEAAAFLAEAPTLSGAATFEPAGGAAAVREAVESDPALLAAALAATQTRFEIVVTDGAGEGFNDPTPAAPVAGNTGTTVGQQRLKAFEYAAAIWATFLQSTVPIKIEAAFNPLQCTATGAVLGSAGPRTFHLDFGGSGGFFPGAEQPSTLYVQAMANQRAGIDLSPTQPDLLAQFNSNLGQSGCLTGSGWYYGFDGNDGSKIDLVVVLLHEFGHGLGFLSAVNLTTGTNLGGPLNDVWNSFLAGRISGTGPADTLWKDMIPSQRTASATSNNLVWIGGNVNRAAANLYDFAVPRLSVSSPGGVGPFTGAAASFGPAFSDTAIAGALVAATDQDEDGGANRYNGLDACTPLTNAAAVSGKVALIDRGPCAANAQVRNLQAAGALAAVIADNVAVGTPPDLNGDDGGLTIPAMSITKSAGDTLRNRLGSSAVNVSLALFRTSTPGIDTLGRVKMYAPSSLQLGSSVSHFDVANSSPNLLMEPAINDELGQDLDLTDELMRDIGWLPDQSYNGLDDRRELNLSVSQLVVGVTAPFPSSFVRPGQPFTLTITARNQGFTTAGVTFAGTFPATYVGASWTAAYTGGAAGPVSGSGNISAPLTLPAGSSAVFTVVATAPAAPGSLGANQVTLTKIGGANLIDVSGAADDSSTLSLNATSGEIRSLFLPQIRR